MDAFLLERLARELRERWAGAWVQGVWQDLEGRLVLRLRALGRTAHLLLSARAESPDLGLVVVRPACPPRPPALAAYLRAHAEGGRLAAVRCQRFERAVELELERPEGGVRVVLEATGRRGNLLALDAGGILRAALRWEGPEKSSLRPLEPGAPYRPPPSPERVAPDRVGREELEAWLAAGEPLHRRVAGLSPELAAEVAHRHGVGGAPAWEAFASVVAAYGKGEPVWEYPGRLSAVELTHRGEPVARHAEALPRAGAWLEEALGEARAEAARRRREREQGAIREKLARRLERIEADLGALPDRGALRAEAEALAAGLHRVVPGSPWADVPDPWDPARTLRIALDPKARPGENLERLYRKVRRVEVTREALVRRREEARREAEAGAPPGAGADGAQGQARQGTAPTGPFRRYVSSDGWSIWVGRNGAENDRLLREARPWDLWFHARESPGAHVLLRKPGKEARPPDRTLAEAAGLAALYSRRRGEGSAEVMVAEVSRVRKPKGAGRGRVVVAGERTLRVAPGAGNPKPVLGAGGASSQAKARAKARAKG